MEKKETKLVKALRKDFKELYVKEYTTGWREQRFIRNIELGIMSLKNTEKYISEELDKASEEEIQKILDKMPQYVERNGREYYLDFYIKDISGERYYCSCYTNGDKKLTPEYDEEILLRSLVKTRDYLSKLKE